MAGHGVSAADQPVRVDRQAVAEQGGSTRSADSREAATEHAFADEAERGTGDRGVVTLGRLRAPS